MAREIVSSTWRFVLQSSPMRHVASMLITNAPLNRVQMSANLSFQHLIIRRALCPGNIRVIRGWHDESLKLISCCVLRSGSFGNLESRWYLSPLRVARKKRKKRNFIDRCAHRSVFKVRRIPSSNDDTSGDISDRGVSSVRHILAWWKMFLNVKFVRNGSRLREICSRGKKKEKNGDNSKLLPILIYEGTNFLYFYPQFLFSIKKREGKKRRKVEISFGFLAIGDYFGEWKP